MIVNTKDELRAVLIGRLLAKMRDQRDSAESHIVKKPRTVTDNENISDRLAPLNDHILDLEQKACGTTLEELLKDAQYASYTILNVENELSATIEKNKELSSTKTLQPIEVKIEGELDEGPKSVLLSANQESNFERAAKREAHVLARIAELRRSGLWSNNRLPKCVEPERNKTHWDFLLEEVKWMARDFRTEMHLKRTVARKTAGSIAKIHREKEIELEKMEKNAIRDKKKLCASVAKMVRDFWQNVNKVVDIRAKEIIDLRVRKLRSKQLMNMIDHVGELTTAVQEGLQQSKTPSIASHDDDKEFSAGDESESDDERTIANAEKSSRNTDIKEEIDALTNEANTDLDDLLASLPPEYLAAYGYTADVLDEMRKENKKIEEKTEGILENIVSQCSKNEKSEFVPSNEKNQDRCAEDGNGDGRGVFECVDYAKLNSVNSDERQKELANIAEEALKFQPKGYTLETTQVKTPVPFLIRGTLREYQMVGLDWLVTLYEKNLNGILADEMGLGKTIQTISLLAHLACREAIWGPHLIVVPTSVILNWEMEFKKWCPALKILTYFGSAKDRAEKRKGWSKPNAFHVCITSYKTVTTDIRAFKMKSWQYMILDEAQNIKNWKSQRWQALLNVRARRRLLLTGTPLQNSLMELWSLMHFLMPAIFASHDDFKDWFSNPLSGMMEGNVEYNAPLVQQLHKVLRPFILRRLKSEVEKQLPAKTEHIVKCDLSKRQRYLYDDFMSRRSTKENLKSGNMMSVLNIVMQLRKCCNHPNLFEPRPVVSPFVTRNLQKDVPACIFEMAKADFAVEPIPDIFHINERIGSWSTSVTSKKPLIEEIEHREKIMDETNKSWKNDGNMDVNGSDEEGKTNGTATVINSGQPFIRSRTVLNTAPLTISTERSGFHYTMSSSGSKTYLDPNATHSPPLKKPKLSGAAVNYADYVPCYVLDRIDDSKRHQLEMLRRRFGRLREPIISKEMICLFEGEVGKVIHKRIPINIFMLLMDHIKTVSKHFGMYVEPVLTDAWQCRPSSSGLPSFIRQNVLRIEEESRRILLEKSTNLDNQLSISRMLQFPELRLIEYDCGKLQMLAGLLRQLYIHKHRCLIFTQMSRMLDVLQTFLSHHGYQYFRLDGTTGIEQRQAMMERFNADPKIFCFILSTRSGGVGVNLTGADTVIFYDSDWNPTMDAQAQDRCHRIGQTRNVSIYRLISDRTIEENILKKAMQKRRLGELAIDEAGFTPEFFRQSDNIRDLFDGENIEVSAPVDVPTNEKDLENAMAKCEDEVDVVATKLAKAEAKVDQAEFDEALKTQAVTSNLALGGDEVDDKYLELINQLKPIERYAVGFWEEEYRPEFEEEEKEALALVEQKGEEWSQKLLENQGEQHASEPSTDRIDALDDDFYLGGNLLDEVRKRRKYAKKTAQSNKNSNTPSVKPRIRSPSKRKSNVPSFTPYVSAAPHALGSPPSSPIRKTKQVVVRMIEESDAVNTTVPRRKKKVEPRPVVVNHTSPSPSPQNLRPPGTSLLQTEQKYVVKKLTIPAIRTAPTGVQRRTVSQMTSNVRVIPISQPHRVATRSGPVNHMYRQVVTVGSNVAQRGRRLYVVPGSMRRVTSSGTTSRLPVPGILAEGFDETMPSWFPPSPPLSDSECDLKFDETFDLIYELDPMNEARLPSQIHEMRRPLAEKRKQSSINDLLTPKEHDRMYDAVAKCLQMPPNQPIGSSPSYTENSFSMDDSNLDVKPDITEIRPQVNATQKTQKKERRRDTNKNGRYAESSVKRGITPPPPYREEPDYDGADWSIIEDYALLQAVNNEIANKHELEKSRRGDGMVFNWDLISSVVNRTTRYYRSARQCSIRYQMFVRPKELGQLVASDPITKKTVKVDLTPTELVHLRKGRVTTEAQYNYDCGAILDKKTFSRFKMVKSLAARKIGTFWRGPKDARNLECLLGKLPQAHETRLHDFEVKIGQLLDAEEVSRVPEDKIIFAEAKKKTLNPRSSSPEMKCNEFLKKRPHAISVAKSSEPLPARTQKVIIVPPLQNLFVANQPPQHNVIQSQQQVRLQGIVDSTLPQMVQSQHQMQGNLQPQLQRRTTPMGSVQQHYIQQGVLNQNQQGQSFVVVHSSAPSSGGTQEGSVQTIAGQRITQYITPQHQMQQQQQQQISRGGSQTRNVSGGTIYSSNPQVVVQTAARSGQRVMRGGITNRMYVQQSGERQYVMQQSQPVRVMPTGQRVVTQGLGQRRGQPQPGTVAAMVMPGRGGGVSQLRTVPRTYPTQAGRINVMVTSQNSLRQNGVAGQLGTTGQDGSTTVKRQLIGAGRGIPPIGSSRVDSPQTVAQVVLAPPSSSGTSILHVQQRHQHHHQQQQQLQIQPQPVQIQQQSAQIIQQQAQVQPQTSTQLPGETLTTTTSESTPVSAHPPTVSSSSNSAQSVPVSTSAFPPISSQSSQ
ncbi:unnamed protein product [Caenorhabditis bovis]|uniref:Uncharacterized protein n=1 Tax=Caenorhabditis bovis TaxID=2654633 RepID=A0A8S1EM05_9PELO|nr:unnamed protein product [Caenorhabditis bovis]